LIESNEALGKGAGGLQSHRRKRLELLAYGSKRDRWYLVEVVGTAGAAGVVAVRGALSDSMSLVISSIVSEFLCGAGGGGAAYPSVAGYCTLWRAVGCGRGRCEAVGTGVAAGARLIESNDAVGNGAGGRELPQRHDGAVSGAPAMRSSSIEAAAVVMVV